MRLKRIIVGAVSAASVAIVAAASLGAQASRTNSRLPRTPDGKPDLSGIWQAVNTAHYDLEAHAARIGPLPQLGAVGAVPGGLGVVEGGAIPYQPWALEQKKQNMANWLKLDPVVKCYMPGVPRATYMPFPFEIVQSPGEIFVAYEFPEASRVIYMDPKTEDGPADYWMGWSRGRWEGDTLVVDVTSLNDQTWFDRAGNFHSDQLHVIERYTRKDLDHLWYEATIEDRKVFTRTWKISMPLYRRVEKDMQRVEFNCVPFVEELLYGHLYRKRE
jgi:hypothetical protein